MKRLSSTYHKCHGEDSGVPSSLPPSLFRVEMTYPLLTLHTEIPGVPGVRDRGTTENNGLPFIRRRDCLGPVSPPTVLGPETQLKMKTGTPFSKRGKNPDSDSSQSDPVDLDCRRHWGRSRL